MARRAEPGANLRLVERLRLFRRRSRPWLVHDLDYRLAVTGVPFDPLRSARILAWLLDRGLAHRRDVSRPLPASLENIGRVHSEAYLASIERPETLEAVFGFVPPDDLRQRVIDQQRLVSGGTIQATRLALRTGRPAINLGGGFHHASPGRGMALCLFNDIAVAIARLRVKGFDDNVLVIDLDLHDGNGTRVAFSGDPTVFTFSIHNQTWDSRSAIADRTIELGAGVEDRTYLDTLAAELPPVMRSHRPGLVIYVAGTDPSADDQMGNWSISDDGMLARDRFVFELVEQARPAPRFVTVLGGGYGEAAWRHTARGIAWLVSRQVHRPSRGMEPVVKLFRHLQAESALKRRSGVDAGWTLTEEDLGAVSPGSVPGGLVLDALTPHAVELSLERFGFFEQIRALGFAGLVLRVEATPPLGHTLRLFSEEPGPGAEILMEQRISRNRSTIAGMELLYAEWLLLQNPRASFTPERPPLPGQDLPGLGLLREVVAWWIVLCEELRLDGILFVPAHYYMAALGRRHLSFRRPEDAAVFEALRRTVGGMDLAQATRAIDSGRVVHEATGEPVRWPAPQMVLAVSERLRRQLGSPRYDEEVRSRVDAMSFTLSGPT